MWNPDPPDPRDPDRDGAASSVESVCPDQPDLHRQPWNGSGSCKPLFHGEYSVTLKDRTRPDPEPPTATNHPPRHQGRPFETVAARYSQATRSSTGRSVRREELVNVHEQLVLLQDLPAPFIGVHRPKFLETPVRSGSPAVSKSPSGAPSQGRLTPRRPRQRSMIHRSTACSPHNPAKEFPGPVATEPVP